MTKRILKDDDDDEVIDYSKKASQRKAHSNDKRKYLKAPVIAGELLLCIAVLVGLFLYYQLHYTGIAANKSQAAAMDSLKGQWQNDTTEGTKLPGDSLGIIRIPKFSDGGEYVVFNGVEQDVLANGPGFYPNSQDFGDDGNSAIAAHRDGWNAPFSEIDVLQTCDTIEIETRDYVLTYTIPSSADNPADRRKENAKCFNPQLQKALADDKYSSIDGHSIIDPSKTDVIWPIPGKTEQSGDSTLSLLTLTTCHPHWSNEQRYIVHAVNTELKRKK